VGNQADSLGGGAFLYQCATTIRSSLFAGNLARRGAALFLWSAQPDESDIRSSTFAMNQPSAGESAIEAMDASPDIRESIVALNDGLGLGCSGTVAIPEVRHSCSYGNAGGDSLCGWHRSNLFADPLFCDAGSQDFTLHDDSPCLPGNNPWGVLIGKYGAGGCGAGSGVEEPQSEATSTLVLRPPLRDPESGLTTLDYALPDHEGVLTIAVYNLRGELVRTLCDGPRAGGGGRVLWDGTDRGGRDVASGIYFVRARFGTETAGRKVAFVR
jgi:hypothetical protein